MTTFRKLLVSSAVMVLCGGGGCTEWNPLFDGFGGVPIARDGGSALDAGPALSGKCDAGTWNVCTGCNGEAEIQRCLDGDWQPCPCPPDMRAPLDMALPDLGMSQDRQPAPDLAPGPDLLHGPDLATECKPNDQQACPVCQMVGLRTCDMNGKWDSCMPQINVSCMNIGGTKPSNINICSNDVVQTCEANCSYGAPHLSSLPDGCSVCDPIDGRKGCSGPQDRCAADFRCSFNFGEIVCLRQQGFGKEYDPCGKNGQDDCDFGFGCSPADGRCHYPCLLASPKCPNGRTCRTFQGNRTCFGFCMI